MMPRNNQFYDRMKQDWVTIPEPNRMNEEIARRLIPQTPIAQDKFYVLTRAGMTPYLAMLTIESDGGR